MTISSNLISTSVRWMVIWKCFSTHQNNRTESCSVVSENIETNRHWKYISYFTINFSWRLYFLNILKISFERVYTYLFHVSYYHWKYRFSNEILFVRDTSDGVDVNTVRYDKTGPSVRERYGTWFFAFIINIEINASNLFYMFTLLLTMIYSHKHTDSGRLNTPCLRWPWKAVNSDVGVGTYYAVTT